ncbi:MAG: RNA polymerase sigma factor SigZ [Anaerolineae bacterium]|nr:RNA polymerase sigma factor SigZ [Anaerolineae bacterium]
MLAAHTETLWRDMNTTLKRFIAKRVMDENTTEDILQDVFLRIHTRADTLKDATKLESWIFQIARNAIIDYYRSHTHEHELPDDTAVDDAEDDELSKKLAPCLRGMIEDLPAKYREALLLTEYEGLSQVELAQRLGISFSGAKSRVQRAREQLKATLLQCCHFELDRFGKILDYYPRHTCCTSPAGSRAC